MNESISKKERKVNLSFKILPSEKELLKIEAEKCGLVFSAYLRLLIELRNVPPKKLLEMSLKREQNVQKKLSL